MQLLVTSRQIFTLKAQTLSKEYPCAIGKGGMVHAEQKREGDGASPIGDWSLKQIFYRADRLAKPQSALPCRPITKDMGWCDAPDHPAYNTRVTLPFAASHEKMWQEDKAYNIVVELGHNDNPPRPNYGSAIFLHVAKPGFTPTQGCIALKVDDLLEVLSYCDPGTRLSIEA